MKVVALVGSMRGNNSTSYAVIKKLMSFSIWEEWKKEIFKINELSIMPCQGCCKCFQEGICPHDVFDDMPKVKKSIKTADVVLIAAPVYFHQIPGSFKNLIDRLSYWAHIFELRGIRVILCAVTASSGTEYVTAYLKKVMSAFGCLIVGCIDIDSQMRDGDIQDKCEKTISKLQDSFGLHRIEANCYQEGLFQSLKQIYLDAPDTHESKIWKERGYYEISSFEQLLNEPFTC